MLVLAPAAAGSRLFARASMQARREGFDTAEGAWARGDSRPGLRPQVRARPASVAAAVGTTRSHRPAFLGAAGLAAAGRGRRVVVTRATTNGAGPEDVAGDGREAGKSLETAVSGTEPATAGNTPEESLKGGGTHGGGGGGGAQKKSDDLFILLFGATLAKTNASFLEIRSRKRWWKRGNEDGLTVPLDTVSDVEMKIKAEEMAAKMLPLAVMFFCATFNLTILQNLKDALVITSGGAEMLPFLSTYVVLPMSIAFTAVYSKLCDQLSQKKIFYTVIISLLACYLTFLLMFPYIDSLHFSGISAGINSPALRALVQLVENWTYSLFFGTAELWGGVVISYNASRLSCWGAANLVCNREEAKAVYPLMGIFANVAQVVSGSYVKFMNANVCGGSLHTSLQCMIGTVTAVSLVMMGAKSVIDRFIEDAPPTKKKSKGSLMDGIKTAGGNSRIRNLTMLVVGYGVAHRLFEFTWKGQLRLLYPSAIEYQGILSSVSQVTGIASILMIGVASVVFRRFGWGTAAAITPLGMMVAGGVFFALSMAGMSAGATGLATAAVMMGAVAQVVARSTKYSMFDAAKEMVYINMTKEEKSKGKAAVDVLGSQIGKSGAAFLTQAVLLLMGSISTALPVMCTAYVSICLVWLRSVFVLERNMSSLGREDEKVDKVQLDEGKGSEQPQSATAA